MFEFWQLYLMWCRQTDIEVRNSWVLSEGCWIMDVFVPEVNVSYLSSISTSLTAQVLIRFTGSGPLTESKNTVIFYEIFIAKPETYFLCINKATNLMALQNCTQEQNNWTKDVGILFASGHFTCYDVTLAIVVVTTLVWFHFIENDIKLILVV